MSETFDLAVIGAGPAGLAAATAAVSAGTVALLDGSPRPGGQFWRHREGDAPSREFGELLDGLSGVDYRPDSPVWFIERDGGSFIVHTRRSVVRARRLVLATGAYDRTVPFPGWDLPGVVTAGGAQALLKGNGVAIGRNVVVAGTGPFLLPVATGLAAFGISV
jgi:NADPH-dependent 2,4-dienoyl-CoA reductase/sulfur reductase-like enzyme